MLEKEQLAAGLEHAVSLLECPRRIVDGAEHERRDDEVEARVLEGEVLGGRAYDAHRQRIARQLALEAACHGFLRLGHDELVDPGTVEGEVRPCAAADLQHSSANGLEQLL